MPASTSDQSLTADKAFIKFQEQKNEALSPVDDMIKHTPLGLGENLVLSLWNAGEKAVNWITRAVL